MSTTIVVFLRTPVLLSCTEHYLLVVIFNCEGGAFIHWGGSRYKKQHVIKQPQCRSLLYVSSYNLISNFIVTFTELHVDFFFLNKTSLMNFFRYLLYPSQLYMFRMLVHPFSGAQLCIGGKVQYKCAVII